MQKSAWLGVLAIVAIGGYFLRADDPKPAPPKVGPDFTGKLAYVQTRGGAKGLAIDNPTIRQIGGRPFLVGKSIIDESVSFKAYFTGAEVWIPIDDIEAVSVFDGVPQLKRAAGQ